MRRWMGTKNQSSEMNRIPNKDWRLMLGLIGLLLGAPVEVAKPGAESFATYAYRAGLRSVLPKRVFDFLTGGGSRKLYADPGNPKQGPREGFDQLSRSSSDAC